MRTCAVLMCHKYFVKNIFRKKRNKKKITFLYKYNLKVYCIN